MSPSDYDMKLKELLEKSVDRLNCAEVFDTGSFHELYTYLCEKSEEIKSEHVVSKQVIAAIFSAQRTIENNAVYNAKAKENLYLANKFAMLLELMAIGETPNDRVPDAPRIV